MSHWKNTLFATLISLLITGCGIQDSTQPPENSISASPKNDGALVKSKKAVIPPGTTKKAP